MNVLSDRRQRILAALIEEYVARALPVGSKTLMEHYGLGVSSATIRNELSMLEEAGYLQQPHTSAGRIPTDIGYRVFVDNLLASGELEKTDDYDRIAEEIRKDATELDTLLTQTTEALTRLTDCLSIVLAPSIVHLRLKQISLISLTDYVSLIVIVTEDGQVLNTRVDFPAPIASDELAVAQGMLNTAFLGKTLSEVEAGLNKAISESAADPLLRYLFAAVLRCLQDSSIAHTRRLGLSALLAKPEFSQSASLLPVVQALDDDILFLQIVDEVVNSDEDPTIRIGSENKNRCLDGVSVIASRYGRGPATGVVAVIGPTRMDYSKVINAVKATSRALEDI